MDIYEIFNEKIKPYFHAEYIDFSSKNQEGYSLFVSEYKKPYPQAMTTEGVGEQLQRLNDKYHSTKNRRSDVVKSQIGRWYVNGFTSAYNFCRRYDKEHPCEMVDYVQLARKYKPTDDIAVGEWNDEKIRRYTIMLGRYEGVLFYQTEHKQEDTVTVDVVPTESIEEETSKQDDIVEEKREQKKGRPVESFSNLLIGSDNKKEKTLEKLHELLKGKRGKKFALVITCAVESGLINRPTYTQLVKEFSDGDATKIGSENSIMPQIGKIHYTTSEYSGMMTNFEDLRTL